MNLTIEVVDPVTLDEPTLKEICEVAAAGFGRKNDDAMQADTINHVRSAKELQTARTEDGVLAAFAVYGRSLWRPSR